MAELPLFEGGGPTKNDTEESQKVNELPSKNDFLTSKRSRSECVDKKKKTTSFKKYIIEKATKKQLRTEGVHL